MSASCRGTGVLYQSTGFNQSFQHTARVNSHSLLSVWRNKCLLLYPGSAVTHPLGIMLVVCDTRPSAKQGDPFLESLVRLGQVMEPPRL